MERIPHISFDWVLPIAYLVISAVAGAYAGSVLKRAADTNSLVLFAMAVLVFSSSSAALFGFYRLDTGLGFFATTFLSMFLSLIFVQIFAGILGENFNVRAFIILLVSICTFAWATAPGTNFSANQNPTPPTEGVSHDDDN